MLCAYKEIAISFVTHTGFFFFFCSCISYCCSFFLFSVLEKNGNKQKNFASDTSTYRVFSSGVNVPGCLRQFPYVCIQNILKKLRTLVYYTRIENTLRKTQCLFFSNFFFISRPFLDFNSFSFGLLLDLHLPFMSRIPFVFFSSSFIPITCVYENACVCFLCGLSSFNWRGPPKKERIVHLYIPRSLRWPYTHSIYIYIIIIMRMMYRP